MTGQELNQLLRDLRRYGAEPLRVEVKAARRGFPRDLWRTVSAFANVSGGLIILGVDEDDGFAVCGVGDPGDAQRALAQVAADMVPAIRPEIELHTVHGRVVVVCTVLAVDYRERPCYYRPSGEVTGAYVRVGDGDMRLTQYEIQLLREGANQCTT